MKLEATVRFLLGKKQINLCTCLIFLLLSHFYCVESQTFKLSFGNSTPMSEALLQSSHAFGFKVAFDAQGLKSIKAGNEITGNTLNEFLSNLLQHSGYFFIYKHGCYLIIENNLMQNGKNLRECQLRGSVIDFETGEQLPYASVTIPNQNIFISTTTNGTFNINNLVSNPIQITINYIGYNSMDTMLTWSGPVLEQTFRLRHKVNQIDSVDVKAPKIDIVEYRNNADFSTTMNPARLIDMPVLAETDIFRSLQLLSGISYSESSSELSIRGGTSDQNLVLFDGQTLYNLSHYYGVFSSINPNIVKDIQVFKGGFDSRYGERISGIVDITGKSGNRLKPALCVDINLLSVNLALEAPVTKKLTFVAAGRRSYSDIYKTSFADKLFTKNLAALKNDPGDTVIVSEPSFYFYDLNGKLNYRISSNENLSLSLYGGKDYFRNSYTASSRNLFIASQDSNSWYNWGISADWQKQWNNAFFSNVLVGTSGFTNSSDNLTNINSLQPNENVDKFLPDSQNYFLTRNRNKLRDFSISMRNTYAIDNYNQLDFGLLVRKNFIYYHKDADKVYVYDNTSQSSWISSLYAQDCISVTEKLILKPGFRFTYYDGTGNFYVEPRFAAKYAFSPQFSCRMATGQYKQFISQVSSQQETSYNKSFWVLANDSINPVLKAWHYVVGATYESENLLVDIESYYKQSTGIQEYIYISPYLKNTDFGKYFQPDKSNSQPPPPEQPSFFISGSGRSYGIDFLIRYKTRHYTNWISYSLSKSVQKFEEINLGEEIPALMDQRHQFSFSNLFSFGNWNFGAVSLISTGRPYVAFTENQNNMPVIRHYERMPGYFRCDMSMNYNIVMKPFRVKTGVSVINLLNTQNYFDVNTRKFDFDSSTFTETNLIQSQKLSINLFLHITL
jgi:ferric enterobactin receptor